MSAHGKDKMMIFDGFREPKGHTIGGSPNGWLIWFKYRTVRVYRGFFPGKTCELLFVRGTISFYNQQLQIFLVGEGDMWNVSM